MKAIVVFNFLMCISIIYGAENKGLSDKGRINTGAPKITVTSVSGNSYGSPVPLRHLDKKNNGLNLSPEMAVNLTSVNRPQNQPVKTSPIIERVKSQPTISPLLVQTPRPGSTSINDKK